MFRNLTFFRFPTTLDLAQLEELLPEAALKPVGPLEVSSRGFVSPFGAGDERLAHRPTTCTVFLTVGGEDKVLPASAVQREVANRLQAIEEREGRKLGGKARKRLRDDVLHELLPRALVKPYRLEGYLDLDRGLAVVDTASRKAAEGWVSEVRRALGSFPAVPLNAELPPRSVLTEWMGGAPMPEGLALGDEAEVRDASSDGGVVKFQRVELSSDEVAIHLEVGEQCTRLGLSLDDHVALVLGEDLVARKFKLLDGAVDQLENTERDNLEQELDARRALLALEVGRLFDVLAAAFRFSNVEG